MCVAKAAVAAETTVSALLYTPLYALLGSNRLHCPQPCWEQVFFFSFFAGIPLHLAVLFLLCVPQGRWPWVVSVTWPPDLAQALYGAKPDQGWGQSSTGKLQPKAYTSRHYAALLTPGLEKKMLHSCVDEGPANLDMLIPWQIQAGNCTLLHLNQDENVQHGACSKDNLLLANQKDYFIMPQKWKWYRTHSLS